jgi:CBS domain-containing protein
MERVRRLEVETLLAPPIVVTESTPISKVVGILKNKNAYEAFIEEHEKVKMVMVRDLLKSTNIYNEKVGKLAYHVPALAPNTSLAQAARLMMEYRIRALPIVEKNKLAGKVDEASIIRAIPEGDLNKYRAHDIMTSRPTMLVVEDKVAKARTLMVRRRIDHLPVTRQEKLNGILTSSHIIFNLYQPSETPVGEKTMLAETTRSLDPPVESIMDTNPLTCTPSDLISHVLQAMTNISATYSIATQVGEIQGIITYRDFMKLVTETIVKEEIPVTIVGLPDDPFEAEQTRTKFTRSVEQLRRSFPYVEQAKAVIKTTDRSTRERRRYEVSVTLVTPKKNFVYTDMGFELANIFDEVSNHLKAIMAERPKRSRESIRYQEPSS